MQTLTFDATLRPVIESALREIQRGHAEGLYHEWMLDRKATGTLTVTILQPDTTMQMHPTSTTGVV